MQARRGPLLSHPKSLGTPKFFPEMPPRGLTAWVVQQLPHYLLSLEGGTCQEGWTGAQRRSGSPGARSAAGGEDPPPSRAQVEPPRGSSLRGQGTRQRPPLSSACSPGPAHSGLAHTRQEGGEEGQQLQERACSAPALLAPRAGSGHRNLRPQDQFPAGIPSSLGQWWLNSPLERRPPRVT